MVCGVGKERPSANGRAEAAAGVAPERKITDGRVEPPGSKSKKGVLTFGGVAAGIASVRCGLSACAFGKTPRPIIRIGMRIKIRGFISMFCLSIFIVCSLSLVYCLVG